MDESCSHVGVVDFGEGPVRVQCTLVGPHEEHVCSVILGSTIEVEHVNVFDGDPYD